MPILGCSTKLTPDDDIGAPKIGGALVHCPQHRQAPVARRCLATRVGALTSSAARTRPWARPAQASTSSLPDADSAAEFRRSSDHARFDRSAAKESATLRSAATPLSSLDRLGGAARLLSPLPSLRQSAFSHIYPSILFTRHGLSSSKQTSIQHAVQQVHHRLPGPPAHRPHRRHPSTV